MNVLVKYQNGVQMSYSLNTYLPWEGFNVVINGSNGRIEYSALEKPYINAGGEKGSEGAAIFHKIRICPLFGIPYDYPIEKKEGGHGGGDPALLDDIFNPQASYDEYHRAADYKDGIKSVMVGVAANKSIASGLPVEVSSLVHW